MDSYIVQTVSLMIATYFPFDPIMEDKEDRFHQDIADVLGPALSKHVIKEEPSLFNAEKATLMIGVDNVMKEQSWDFSVPATDSFTLDRVLLPETNVTPPPPKPVEKRKKSPKTETSPAKEWKAWTHEEEVFLVGAVMDRFFRRGSLSSTRGSDKTGSDDCWPCIKMAYDRAWDNYCRINDAVQRPTERTANHLARRYKVMKIRLAASDMKGETSVSFREYYNEWESKFNVNNRLLRKEGESQKRKRKVKA